MTLNWFVITLQAIIVTGMAVLMMALPAINRRTLVLGVRIPQDRADEPVVRTAISRFRWAVVGAWVVSIVATFALGFFFPVTASIAPMLLFLVLATGAYMTVRTPVREAKESEGWFANVPVRVRADISAAAYDVRLPIGWGAAALLVLVATFATGVVLYPGLPDPMPTHWNGAGQVDAYAAKSIGSVFGPLFIGLGVLALILAVSTLAKYAPVRPVPGETEAQSTARQQAFRTALPSALGQMAVVLALLFAWMSIIGWVIPEQSWAMMAGTIVFLVLIAAVIVVMMMRVTRAGRTADRAADHQADHARPAAEGPDDDRFWRGGLIYINRSDPSVFVPKRFGVGWTVNLGSVWGMVLSVAVVALVVASIAFGIVAGGHQ